MAKGKFEYWLTPDGLLLLSAWARDGLTDKDISQKMGVAESTFYAWKNKFSEISESLKKSKEIADIEVENALYKKALGFKETVKKPVKIRHTEYIDGKKDREYEEVVEAEEEIFVPPDTTAQIFWLKNRKPLVWRDKPETDKADGVMEILKNLRTLDSIAGKAEPNRSIEDYE